MTELVEVESDDIDVVLPIDGGTTLMGREEGAAVVNYKWVTCDGNLLLEDFVDVEVDLPKPENAILTIFEEQIGWEYLCWIQRSDPFLRP